MSYFKFSGISIIVPSVLLLISCGGEDPGILARGNGIQVTVDDFHREFERLLPDDQVSVLEPGGKFGLVTRLAYREMLLDEARKIELPDMERWLEISEDVWMAQKWLERELERIYDAGLDTAGMDSMMSIEVSVTAVLMKDSAQAMDVLEEWRSGSPSQPPDGMALAPWSHEGSSYFDFDGNFFLLHSGNPRFASAMMGHAGAGPAAVPYFGAWAVFTLDTARTAVTEYSVPAAARYYINSRLSAKRDVTVISGAVELLAEHFALADGEYSFIDPEGLDPDLVLAVFPGGGLTAGDVVATACLVDDDNFFNGVPEEFLPYRLPRPMLDPEVDLWVYVEGLAEIRRQAGLAAEEGLSWPESERELTITDQVLKYRVLGQAAEADTAAALEYYRENSDLYDIPELRSIEVAYVPFDWMPEGDVRTFDDLERYYSHTDEEGVLIPTDPCPMELYGGFGEAVFNAPESVLTGPVQYPGDEVFVFFRVVDVIPAGMDDPLVIMPVLLTDCRQAMVNGRLEDYLLELWDSYSIEIDSGLVRELDPWESGY